MAMDAVTDCVILFTLVIALAARLAQQAHIGDADVMGDGFAHVVDGECGHGDGRQGFHFDASLTVAAHCGHQANALLRLEQCSVHTYRG